MLLDGGSSYPPMCELLASLSGVASVVSLPHNPGPRYVFLEPAEFLMLPRRFCVTDPDLRFNSALPSNFLGDLAALIERERIGKAGFALELPAGGDAAFKTFQWGDRTVPVEEWEAQFWKAGLPPLRPGGDPVYLAPIDTTFALYDKDYLSPDEYKIDDRKFLQGVRVASRFTCRHLPRYRDS